MPNETKNAFERAGQEEQKSLLAELWFMLKTNKKYWMAPLILMILLLGLLIILGGTGAAPFIYTLF